MEKKREGSCLCGDVRYEVRGEFEHFFLCHCSRCRKGSGSAHGANLFSSTAKITWLGGEENFKEIALPGTRYRRAFCSRCGAAVPSIQMDGALVVVPAGSLDSALDIRPDAHICVASRAKWDRQLEDVPKIDALPT